MVCLAFNVERFIFLGCGNIDDRVLGLPSGQPLLQKLHQLCLLIISDDQVDGRILQELFSSRLGIAARSHHKGLRIFCLGPVEHLAGFFIRHIGDGAGVDDINVSLFLKVHDLVAGSL